MEMVRTAVEGNRSAGVPTLQEQSRKHAKGGGTVGGVARFGERPDSVMAVDLRELIEAIDFMANHSPSGCKGGIVRDLVLRP